MGVLSTLKRALGLETTPVVRPRLPPDLSPAAERRLAALPAGHGIRLTLVPIPAGWMVQVDEGPVDAPHPGFDGLPVVADARTFERLHGLELDHDGERWRMRAEVTVRARETPNPNGRLYITDHPLATGRAFFSKQASGAPWLVHQLLLRDDIRHVLLRDHTLSVERTPDAPWDPIDRAVASAVREHVLAAGEPLVPGPSSHNDDELERAVLQILEHRILPGIHQDGGDLELVGIEDGVVRVHLVGACHSCPASSLTLKHGIERVLKDAFPGEIDAVEAV